MDYKRGIELRRFLIGFVALLIALAILCSATFGASAISGNGLWRDSTECPILDANEEANNDLNFAAVKVRYDYQINRIYLLFTFEFEEFNDIDSCGVIMNFNGMGNIKMMCDGTAEYNNSVYFAELEDELHDASSKNVLLEATVGIKSGIPDNVIMDLIVIDTNGVKSNTYEVDITEEIEEQEDNPGEETKKSSAEKTTKEKTTKVRTTKIKTTKKKTTRRKTAKRKTTKTKKTRTKKAKTNKDEDDDEDYYDEDDSQVVIDSDIDNNIEINNRRKKLMLALGAAAAIVAIAAGCAAGIKNRKKDRDGGHE